MIRHLMLFALIAATGANAQTPVAAPTLPSRAPPPVPGYCLPAAAGFLESEAKASEGMRKCDVGDTIVFPARSAGAVARMCDFSKAIGGFGDKVGCALVPTQCGSK